MSTETARTACPLDCPDTCSLEVTVTDGRLVAVDAAPVDPGDPTINPFTAGFICHKVKGHARRVYAPERVMTPLIRTGAKGAGEFREATWDEALDLVADRVRSAIAQHGPASVVPYLYHSSAGMLSGDGLAPKLWEALGASEVDETICAATAGEAWTRTFGDFPSAHPEAVLDAGLIVIWGANPAVSSTHLPPLIARARKAGATVVVVDPRRTATAKRADLHIAVRPGTDVVAALAVAGELERQGGIATDFVARHVDGSEEYLAAAREWPVERAAAECDVPATDLRELARLLAGVRPALVRVGWGLERNRNGGSAVRAVLALPLLAGQFGVPGAGVLLSTTRSPFWVRQGMRDLVLGEGFEAPVRRVLNMNRIGAALVGDEPGTRPGEEPVRVLVVQGANPAATAPNQALVHEGLRREDLFTVVHDQVLTDTARFADVVLPATTHFEADDVTVSYGTYVAQRIHRVIDPVGQSRTDNELTAALALRLGFDASRWEVTADRLLAAATPDGWPERAVTVSPEAAVQFRDVSPTRSNGDQRAHLVDSSGDVGVDRVPAYRPPLASSRAHPLTLITPSSPRTINTILGEWNAPAAEVRLHPTEATRRGIVDGDRVRVFNEYASLEVAARVDNDIRSGVCSIFKGLWCRATDAGLTANALVPDTLSDLAGGACFNDGTVEIERA